MFTLLNQILVERPSFITTQRIVAISQGLSKCQTQLKTHLEILSKGFELLMIYIYIYITQGIVVIIEVMILYLFFAV